MMPRGVSEPVSVNVDTEGTGKVEDERLCDVVREFFPLTPRGIIDYLDLRRPPSGGSSAAAGRGRR
ncbi:MAG: methionine adenosyltransferase domain-containing protein [Planctomycetaceae bacterium]